MLELDTGIDWMAGIGHLSTFYDRCAKNHARLVVSTKLHHNQSHLYSAKNFTGIWMDPNLQLGSEYWLKGLWQVRRPAVLILCAS